MKTTRLLLMVLGLAGCARQPSVPPNANHPRYSALLTYPSRYNRQPYTLNNPRDWSDYIGQVASHYGIDRQLIRAIINVESGGNPKAISRSNVIGLMQIKASTAGRAVYRARGQKGQPSGHELKDPAKNIDIGTAYIKLLQQNELARNRNPLTLRYATIVAYVNGAGALFRTFSPDRDRAIAMINLMTPGEFCQHVERAHPAAQAPRYLYKVTMAYQES